MSLDDLTLSECFFLNYLSQPRTGKRASRQSEATNLQALTKRQCSMDTVAAGHHRLRF